MQVSLLGTQNDIHSPVVTGVIFPSFPFIRIFHCNLLVSLKGALFTVPFKHCCCSLHTENVANSQFSSLGVFSPTQPTPLLGLHRVTTVGSSVYKHLGYFHHSTELVSKDKVVEKVEKLKVIKVSSSSI